MNTARVGLGAVGGGTTAVAAAYASAFLVTPAPVWAGWAMALGIGLLCGGVMVLGVARPGRRLGAAGWAIGFAVAVVLAGFGLALVLPPDQAGAALIAGLPRRAALVLYGVGLLPALVLPVGYALTFDRQTLDAEVLDRIRGVTRRRPEGEG